MIQPETCDVSAPPTSRVHACLRSPTTQRSSRLSSDFRCAAIWSLVIWRADGNDFLASRRRFRLKMNSHVFPKAGDNKCLFDHRLDRFNHRLDHLDHRRSEICSALGCINTLADWSTFKPDTGTIPDAHSHRNGGTEGNTCSYSRVDAVTKSSPHASASTT